MKKAKVKKEQVNPNSVSRRNFLGKAGGATAAVAAASAGLPSLFGKEINRRAPFVSERSKVEAQAVQNFIAPGQGNAVYGEKRKVEAFKTRLKVAVSHARNPVAQQNPGGDLGYADHAGEFTKCLVHDNFGRVDTTSYNSYINAV